MRPLFTVLSAGF